MGILVRMKDLLPVAAVAVAILSLLHSVDSASADYHLRTWTGLGGANTMMAAPNGDVWVLARSRDSVGPDNRLRLYRITRQGALKYISSTRASRTRTLDDSRYAAGSMAVGPDGNIWVAIGDVPRRGRTTLFRLTPSGRKLSATRLPSRTVATSMASGPDGRVWILSTGRDRIARVDTRGRVDQFKVKGASRMSQIIQGSGGDMWAVARGLAVRIDSWMRAHRYQTADQGRDAAVSAVRGTDDAIWISALGAFQRITTAGQMTSIPLKYPTLDGLPYPGDFGPLGRKRFPMSMALQPDGRIGFVAAVVAENREGTFSGLESLGTVLPGGTVEETKPVDSLINNYFDGTGHDPLLNYGRFGVGQLVVGPDGRMWILGALDEGAGILSVADDSIVYTPVPGSLSIVARQASARSVQVKMTCAGSPGKFCSGNLRLKRGRIAISAPTKYALAVGDQLCAELSTRTPLPAGRLTTTGTSRDVPTGTLTNVKVAVQRGVPTRSC